MVAASALTVNLSRDMVVLAWGVQFRYQASATPFNGEPMAIEVGQPAPDFTLPSDTHGEVTLSALRGQTVVLYFYPKDNTPGCTTQACGFRDNMARLESAGVMVLGVSRDSLKRHENFRKKYELNFPLLTDPEGVIHQLYDAWGEKTLYGKKYIGPIRSTFIIDGEGIIRSEWRKVRVKGHVDAVLEALEAIG